MYEKRTYRNLVALGNRKEFQVTVKETDLHIQAAHNIEEIKITREAILTYRGYIENYISQFPEFATTLRPWHLSGPAPAIIQEMAQAGQKAGVGPMASVAGAMAHYVGKNILKYSNEVIVENGGDIFLKTLVPLTVAVFAGKSPLNLKIGLRVNAINQPMGICTSSATIGHSLSLGKADAVCVVSNSCALADAAATSIGNKIKSASDINPAIEFAKTIQGLNGLVIIIKDKIGMWGDIEIVPVGKRA